MKTKILTSILIGVLVTCFVSTGLAIAANGNGAGLERVPVFIGFRQTPGPSEQALVRAHGGAIKYSYTLVPAIAASIPEPAIQGLRRNPNVTIVEPDIEVYAVDAELDNSWGVKHIGAGFVHPTNTGADVKVAIIDTGIDYTHPDLDDNYKGGYDFVNSDSDPKDDNGHGTHCAGIVAAEDNDTGVVGVAPGAHVYALKVLNRRGSGNFSDVVAALQWAEANDMDVTSNSYGSSGDPGLTVRDAFSSAASAGIVNVCAAGNEGAGADTVIYPAKYDSCIAVAATDSDNIRASFSSTGPDVELAAPGVSIYSTYLRGGYATMSGTSMACPHVAGVVALMISGSGYSRETLRLTADDLGNPLWYGYGLVNAVEAVAGGGGGDSAPTVSIDYPEKGQILNGFYTVLVSASDNSAVVSVELSIDGGAYLDITANFDDITGFYYYDWNTILADDGDYTLQAQATDDAVPAQSTESIVVNISVDNVDDPPTATIANPADGSTVSGMVTIQVDATDAEDAEGVLEVEVSIDGGTWTLVSYNFVSDYYELGWDTTNLTEDSQHTIRASASDSVTNTTNATQVTVTVDNSTPDQTMHVDELSGESSWSGRVWWDAYVDIVVGYGSDDLVKGAIVHGMWSTGQSAISQVTDSGGWCQVILSGIHKKNATVTFTVTDIVHSEYEYTKPPVGEAPFVMIPRP